MVTFHPFPPYFTIFPCHWGWILTLGTHRIPVLFRNAPRAAPQLERQGLGKIPAERAEEVAGRTEEVGGATEP